MSCVCQGKGGARPNQARTVDHAKKTTVPEGWGRDGGIRKQALCRYGPPACLIKPRLFNDFCHPRNP